MKKLLLLVSTLCFIYIQVNAQCPPGRFLNKTFAVDSVVDIQYGSNTATSGSGTTDLFMDIYMPAGDTMQHRPVVIFAHGGSFVGGSRKLADMRYVCKFLAQRGYVTATISYRLESALSFALPNAGELMVKEVVRAAQDGKSAVRFFRKDAATTNTYKIDSTQIYFGGTSAGAILALHLAYMDEADPLPANWITWANSIGGFEGSSGNPGYSSRVKAVVSFAGAIGDVNWMNERYIPWASFHSRGDATVPDSIGYPLGIPTLPLISGGRIMDAHSNSTGQPHYYRQYPGASHPPFSDGLQATWDTIEYRTVEFLYKTLTCNPDAWALGINNHYVTQDGNIDVYPVPATTNIHVRTISNDAIDHVSILDIQGKTIAEYNYQNESEVNIDISSFNQGMYFLCVHSGTKKIQSRIIKQ